MSKAPMSKAIVTPSSTYEEKHVADPATDSGSSSLADKAEEATSPPSSSNNLPKDEVTKIDHFAHLPPEEAAVLHAQIDIPTAKVTFFRLYRYATKADVALLLVGVFAAIVSGALFPCMTIIFGSLTQTFTNYFVYNGSSDTFQHDIDRFASYIVYLGIGEVVFSVIATGVFIDRGEALTARLRAHYLEAVLRQNVAFFDKLGSGEVTSRITGDTNLIQEGISQKVSLIVSGISTFIAAFVVGFIKSWKLTFILMSVVVAIVGTMGFLSKFMAKYGTLSLEGYSVGGSLAEEVFSSIRNVQAFGIQERLAHEYDKYLVITRVWAFRQGRTLGIMIGTLWFYVFCDYALAFWQGSRFVVSNTVGLSSIVSVLMSLLIGAFQLGQMAPHARSIASALTAAAKIYSTIDRVPVIDSASEEGEILSNIKGDIELKSVKFIYPSRPDVTILEDMNLKIPAGKTVALVGSSGSGKSTIIGLVERFYAPISGLLTLDGHDVTKLNTRWLRQNISLVSQEPTLFACSVYENVVHGLIGTEFESADDEKKRELVVAACEQANAWSFIQTLPEGLDTNVGERGFLMSGGQKQRIAIARAIVSNPKILLLDEATSALDTKSEGIVQEALDRASKDRTTIVIAHRLSTIKDADQIVVMSKGKIIEQGTHNELLDLGGMYSELVEAQQIKKLQKNNSEDDSNATPIEVDDHGLVVQEDTNILDLTKLKTQQSISSNLAQPLALDQVKYSTYALVKTFFGLNKEEHKYIYIGAAFAFINGCGYPVLAVLFAKCIQAFEVTSDEFPQMRHNINLYSGLFFMMAIIEGIAQMACVGILAYASQALVRKIRYQSFRQILRQDVAFFDLTENTTGALTGMLSKDAQNVDGLSGATSGQIINSGVTLIVSFILSVSVNWRLALVCAACVPLLLACGFLRIWLVTDIEQKNRKAYSHSAAFACEATAAIRTVASLTRESEVFAAYTVELYGQVKRSRNGNIRASVLYGLAQGIIFFILSLGFWYGGTLLKTKTIGLTQFFITFMSMIFGSQSAGTIFSFAPDMGKAKQSAQSIRALLDRQPVIDSWSEDGLVPESVEGHIEFKNVHFRYPTRIEVPVLRGLDLVVQPGQYVALVGASGCGKSTTISLIESFYLPLHGSILLDGHNINDLNINAYRSHVALVQQEPVLYAGSIKYNIALGSLKEVTDEEIYEAAREANIHDFIMSLPDGYDTFCGNKGTLLSGGQKQRVAIARALIRQPKILLLDEATSALDSESERVVQMAIDKAAKGRTTIAVAHRLSTIQNADVIYVFENGKILESGTHQELLANRSKYYELVQLQALERQ
ncbi:P-loop containing nucleoside triphosphate hydrolase protein [Limtongia smithiae]|uniref:P-loop containing nucleoside triphosphate hydrolase protein n=1 Tax=Limtongia smithiae TaxID=1125753 RepID=UPI0034CE6E3D